MNRQRGFSLVELMVVILIMGILMGIAGPAFVDFVRRSQSMGFLNEFVSDVNMARSEALRKRTRVVICSRQTDSSCGSATDWATGYLIFVDADSDGVFDAGELLVKAVQSPGSSLTFSVIATATTNAVASLTFRPSGGVPTASLATVCAQSGVPGKRVSVTITGQITTASVNCP